MSNTPYWRTIIKHVEALPESQKRFLSFDYDGFTEEGDACGCLVGQLAKFEEIPIDSDFRGDVVPDVAVALSVPEFVVNLCERHNDRYRAHDNREAACRARYHYMLGVLGRYARDEDVEYPEDHEGDEH